MQPTEEQRREGVRRRRDNWATVYIHVPFCARICPYCDFAVTSLKRVPHEDYAEALLRQWRSRRGELEGRDVRSIYVGGGTPSRLEAGELGRVVDRIASDLGLGAGAEITIEANPVDVSARPLATWRAAGINRVSLGCQSFDSGVLKSLGRNHSGEQALSAARALLDEQEMSVSVDLIYGAPAQTESSWARDVDLVAGLCEQQGLEHVSSYHLTIEPGTPFAKRLQRGELVPIQEERARGCVARLKERLKGAGVAPYEVSSWAKADAHSRHNSAYWAGAEYLGLGAGAHGLRIAQGRVERARMPLDLGAYMGEEQGGALEVEAVSWEEHLSERMLIGLRSRFGLDLDMLAEQFGLSPAQRDEIARRAEPLWRAGWLERQGALWRPTWEGMQRADALGERLIG